MQPGCAQRLPPRARLPGLVVLGTRWVRRRLALLAAGGGGGDDNGDDDDGTAAANDGDGGDNDDDDDGTAAASDGDADDNGNGGDDTAAANDGRTKSPEPMLAATVTMITPIKLSERSIWYLTSDTTPEISPFSNLPVVDLMSIENPPKISVLRQITHCYLRPSDNSAYCLSPISEGHPRKTEIML